MDDRREAETPGTATTGGQLLSFLEQIGENLRRKRLLEWGSRIGFWSTALALVTLAIWYFAESFPVWVPALVLGFGLGGLAMLTAFSKRPPASEVARYLDARLAAHERYLTAEQCAREGNNNEVEDALLEQISVECGGMSAARLAPMEPPWETWGAVSILVAVLVFLLLWLAQWLIGMLAAPTVDEPVKQLVQEMKKVEQELKKPEAGKEANDVAKKLAQLMDDLAKGKKPDPETVRKALLDLPQVQKAMEQAGQKSPKLGRVAQFLSKSNFADRMDKALQSKDMKEVTDLSRELAQSIQDTGDDSPKAQQQQKSGQQQQSQQQSQQPPQQASAKGKPCESGPPGAKGQNGAGGQGGSVGPGASSGASSSAAGVPGAGAGKGKGSGGGGASPGANVTLGQGGGGGSPIESNSSSPSSDSDGGRGGQNQPGAQGSSQGQGSGNSAGQSGGAQGQQAGKDGKDGKDPGQSGGAQGQQAGKDSKEGKDPGQSGGAQGQQAGKDGQGANGQKAGEGGKQPDGKQGGEAGQSQPGKGMAGNGPGGSFASQAPMTPREKDLLDKLKQVAQGGKGKASGDVLKEMGKVLSGAAHGRDGRTDAFAQNVRKLAADVRSHNGAGSGTGSGAESGGPETGKGGGKGGSKAGTEAGAKDGTNDAGDTKEAKDAGAGVKPLPSPDAGPPPPSPEGTVVKLEGGKPVDEKPGEAGDASQPGGVPVPSKRVLPRQVSDPARKRELEQHYKEETSRYLNRERVPAEYRELIQEYFQ